MRSRTPTVAGQFYPDSPRELKDLVSALFSGISDMGDCYGVVAPHAGLQISGRTAAIAYSSIPAGFSGTIILIGPSHQGYPTCVSALPWETPVGSTEPDRDFIAHLDCPVDESVHQVHENSLEVQMPLIIHRFPSAYVVPVLMGDQSLRSAYDLAKRLYAAIVSTGKDVRIVASSDFSHYVPEEMARRGDLYAIDALDNLDTEEFYRRIREKSVSACGYGPIATMVEVCRAMGAEHARLLHYATSGDVTGDRVQVVGYAAIAVV